jgi:hypothetical protein
VLDWRARYEKGKELAEQQKELDKELAKKLDAELTKARQLARKQRRTVYLWVFLGVVAEIIWSALTGFLPLLGICLTFLPLGGWVFTRGLRNLVPPLDKRQIRSIILGWFISHGLGGILIIGGTTLILLIDSDLSSLQIDFSNLRQTIITVVVILLVFLGIVVSLVSGPIGGLLTLGRIRRHQEQRFSVASSPSSIPAS